MIQRALISVSDKTGIVDLARSLSQLGVEIVSTGGTYKEIAAHDIPVTEISSITGFPECLDGRVKTLHPFIHAGLLADRAKPDHMDFLKSMDIVPIDLVVVNLYPFKETVLKPGASFAECVENIDIGGPSMLRAAAKNHAAVAVVTDPADYDPVLREIAQTGDTTAQTRFALMVKVFEHTAAYDALIARYMRAEASKRNGEEVELFPDQLTLTYEKQQNLRYGENPFQRAVFYREPLPVADSLAQARQLHGKELSYNNISDTDAAIAMVKEFDRPACVAVKHANPCGIAVRDTIDEAWERAYQADPVSVFGGIVALNRPVNRAAAESMAKIFLEVIVAPSFDRDAFEILSQKKNIRLLELPEIARPFAKEAMSVKGVGGGLLVQQNDNEVYDPADLRLVTRKAPTEQDLKDCYFGMQVVKHVKSNAIVLVKDGVTVGVGPGQVNRVTALEIAIKMAGDKAKGAVLASDAFFPFDDSVRLAGAAGIEVIIQPGGSVRDDDSIKACDELGIAMVFTGKRHFLH
ncbi:MAG: bifunctional phosphoribosylaminoimidazolecarboxamide formyltransferase/IMP cyclohydrolase [Fastidiosipilaceae bacterium]|jgi:phosphoribosylaminoimidazolecarboxamide formyltransferase/IMP cyclohydrolase